MIYELETKYRFNNNRMHGLQIRASGGKELEADYKSSEDDAMLYKSKIENRK